MLTRLCSAILLIVFLPGCAGDSRSVVAPCQPHLVCYEDGTATTDTVRVFVGPGGYPVIVASRQAVGTEAVVEATEASFARHQFARVAIVYRYQGDQVQALQVIVRDDR